MPVQQITHEDLKSLRQETRADIAASESRVMESVQQAKGDIAASEGRFMDALGQSEARVMQAVGQSKDDVIGRLAEHSDTDRQEFGSDKAAQQTDRVERQEMRDLVMGFKGGLTLLKWGIPVIISLLSAELWQHFFK